jgi:hypothetical protein
MVGQKLLKWGVFLIVLAVIAYLSLWWSVVIADSLNLKFNDGRVEFASAATFGVVITSIFGIIGYLAFMR